MTNNKSQILVQTAEKKAMRPIKQQDTNSRHNFHKIIKIQRNLMCLRSVTAAASELIMIDRFVKPYFV